MLAKNEVWWLLYDVTKIGRYTDFNELLYLPTFVLSFTIPDSTALFELTTVSFRYNTAVNPQRRDLLQTRRMALGLQLKLSMSPTKRPRKVRGPFERSAVSQSSSSVHCITIKCLLLLANTIWICVFVTRHALFARVPVSSLIEHTAVESLSF